MRPVAQGWPHGGRSPRRAFGVLAVVAAHLVLLLAALQATVPTRRGEPNPAAERPALWWLWPVTPAARPAPVAEPSRPLPTRTPAPRLPPTAAARTAMPAAPPREPAVVDRTPASDAAPADRSAAITPSTTGPAPPANGAGPALRPAPLQLALPRRPPASEPPPAAWATQDPRVATPRSAGDRFAATLGTDLTLKVQPLNGGGQRFQQGTGCVEVRPAREAQINPFDRSAQALPRQVTGC